MHSSTKKYLLIFAIICGLAVAGVGFYFPFGQRIPLIGGPPEPQPALTIEVAGANLVLVKWEHLPDGTAFLNISRKKKGTDAWELWKRIPITDETRAGGSAFILLAAGEDAHDYSYSGEAKDKNEKPLWTSPPAGVVPPGGETAAPPPPAAPPGTSTSTVPVPTPLSGTSTLPAEPPSPTSTGSTPPPPPETTTYYYTPQLILSGSSTPKTAAFWVQHVEKHIELGWQNIAPDTTRAIVSRAVQSAGPWTELLRQEQPVKTNFYLIRIVDNTLYVPRHYRLETFKGGVKTATFGPHFLDALPK